MDFYSALHVGVYVLVCAIILSGIIAEIVRDLIDDFKA